MGKSVYSGLNHFTATQIDRKSRGESNHIIVNIQMVLRKSESANNSSILVQTDLSQKMFLKQSLPSYSPR